MAEKQSENNVDGKIIICTYPKPEPDDFAPSLEQAGATVYFMPAIEIGPLPYRLEKNLASYDWLIFTSKNGIRFFNEDLKSQLKGKIAVLGEATATELRRKGIEPDFTGSGKSGRDLAAELKTALQPNQSILLVLGELAPDILTIELEKSNPVDRVNVYQNTIPECFNPKSFALIAENNYDLMIVTSPSAIKNLYLAFQPFPVQWRVISIGKVTTTACRELGIEPLDTAINQCYNGLAETTLKYLQHSKR
ncbi:MAG: uroporphyrinogen-III synthase [Mangrovibacterium sp.]